MDRLCDLLVENPAIVAELAKAIPSFLWFLLFCLVLAVLYRPIRYELFPRLSNLKAMGVELSFVKESIDSALKLAEKSPQWKIEVTPADKKRALARVRRHLDFLRDAQVLWVDDHPENNLNERKMLHRLNVEIDTARSSSEALSMLTGGSTYDLVLSDIARGEDGAAGLDFLTRLRMADDVTPVIFYVGYYEIGKGIPPGAFGITNRPDELLHLILDVLERKR